MSLADVRERAGAVGLSAAQRGIWLSQQLLGSEAVYGVAELTELRGELDPGVWAEAADAVLAATPALRLRLVDAGDGAGLPAARYDSEPARCVVHDLSTLLDPESEARRRLDAALGEDIDLADGVVSRAELLVLGGDRALWFLRVHHVATDGYGFALITDALAREYTARLEGEHADANAADGDREGPDDAALAELLSHRVAREAAESAANAVPPARPGVPLSTGPADVSAAPARVRVPHRGTPGPPDPAVHLAALAILADAVHGRGDAIVGVHTMNRPDRRSLRVVDSVQNVVPLHLVLDPDETLDALLRRVRDQWASARLAPAPRHEALRALAGLAPDQALWDVALNVVPFSQELRFGRARGRSLPLWDGPADALTVDVRSGGEGEIVTLLAPDGALDAVALSGQALLLGRALTALGEVAKARSGGGPVPGTTLRSLDLRGDAEAGIAPGGSLWQERDEEYPESSTWVIGAIDRASASGAELHAPDAELDGPAAAAASHRLSRALLGLGVRQGERVAVCLPRSAWGILAFPAVWDAGAAVIPLDPAWPAARLDAVLARSGARWLLVGPGAPVAATSPREGVRIVDLGEEATERWIDAQPPGPILDEERGRAVGPADLAYILFTSGSTGTPKGVGVEHAQLGNFARTLAEVHLPRQRAAAGASVLDIAHEHPLVFDSALNPLVSFLHGHRLHVPAEAVLRDPAAHLEFLMSRRIQVLDVSPAVLEGLLDAGLVVGEGGVAAVTIGGDACSPRLWDRLRGFALRGAAVCNAYGPTENTVDASVAWLEERERPSIGRILPRQRGDVVDHLGRPLPAGLVGQLVLAGESVARGYVNSSDAGGFGEERGGGRSYATGDLVRREADGTLTFLGRADEQLSVRGVRVEPGEVEAALLALPGVSRAVVTLRDDGQGPRLVAHIVAGPGWNDRPEHTRAALLRRLPTAMIPAHVVRLDALPLTDRGKVDRAALPAPEAGAEAGRPLEAMDAAERCVASAFARALGLEARALTSSADLFELGGHSLTAAAVAAELERGGYAPPGLASVFGASSIESLAATLRPAGRRAPAQPEAARAATGSAEDAAGVAAGTTCPELAAARGIAPGLTAAQRRIWAIEAAEGPSALYAIPLAIDLGPTVDERALERAVLDTALAHRALRTVVAADAEGLPAPRELGGAELARALGVERVPGEATDPLRGLDLAIDVATQPPLRAWIVGEPGGRQALVLAVHHIAADGWALSPLLDTFAAAYRARCGGEGPPAAPDPTVSEPGFSPADVDWWRSALAGLPEETSLPLDRPRPDARSREGGEVLTDLEPALAARLRRRAGELGVSPFVLISGVLAGLLRRCGAEESVPLGLVVSGREPGAAAVTFQANTVVDRIEVGANPRLDELIERAKAGALAAIEHAAVPFDAVVSAVNPARSTRRHPLFQVMLVAQDTAAERLDLGHGAPARVRVLGTGTAKFDLSLAVSFPAPGEANAGLRLRWEYARDVFDAATVQDLARWFVTLLNQALAAPSSRLFDRPLDEASLRGAQAEAARCLSWRQEEARRVGAAHSAENAPGTEAAPGSGPDPVDEPTLAGAVRSALRRHAERTALVGVGPDGPRSEVSYAELAARAEALAARLRAAGAGPGELVALLLPRGVEQVGAVLGVVLSGAAYVPLDPDYPVARLADVLEDASPRVLLHAGEPDPRLLAALGPQARVVDLSDPGADPGPPAPGPGNTAPTPRDPAYVIFTSGSTGRPKGVQIPQANVPRLLRSTRHWFGFGPTDTWTLFHSYAFDFAVWELFGALLTGGRLVVVPPTLSRSPEEFLGLLEAERVTVLNQTPSAFAQLVTADAARGGDDGLALRTVILGGEAMDPLTVRRWFGRHRPGTPRIVNMYGITETTVHVTYHEVGREDAGRSPVGEAIPDLSVYLLDAGGHPVPPGVMGELHVGGAGLASGYIGRPELTAERFVADPFAEAAGERGARMYRSGDLAVRTRSGVLDFVGRADRQVQLRGFRIELGEVEAAAASLEEVSEVHARVVLLGADDARLIVHVVGPDPATADPVRFRRQIAQRLPAQMAPAAVVIHAAFPLTVNGKLDAAALPLPVVAATGGRGPNGPAEAAVCEAFAEVLGLPAVAATDSFFDLGGHSLLAVSLTARLRERIGVGPRVGYLMTHPTPELLAAGLLRTTAGTDADGDDGADSDAAEPELGMLLPLRRPATDAGPGVFCIHPAGGLSWCYAGLPRELPGTVPVWGLQAAGVLDPGAQPGSLADMAEAYIERMRQVQPEGPYHLLGWSLGGMVAQAMAARLGGEAGVVALLDAYPSEAERGIEEPPLEDAISAVLAMAGWDDDALGGAEPTVGQLARALTEGTSPLGGLSAERLGALVATYRNTARILREFEHERYDGDVLFFRAARGGVGPEHDPAEWEGHVGGRVEVIDVDCTHREMTQPGPLRQIGAVLRERL
ncbi:MAG: amino acid adenylation domain-containing protein [Arthrobacter sp.]|jgi:nonribosomal peptide synthetase DhbF|nr:amino acid adenylation domain-containing protein [Arthrobacter sp.]